MHYWRPGIFILIFNICASLKKTFQQINASWFVIIILFHVIVLWSLFEDYLLFVFLLLLNKRQGPQLYYWVSWDKSIIPQQPAKTVKSVFVTRSNTHKSLTKAEIPVVKTFATYRQMRIIKLGLIKLMAKCLLTIDGYPPQYRFPFILNLTPIVVSYISNIHK